MRGKRLSRRFPQDSDEHSSLLSSADDVVDRQATLFAVFIRHPETCSPEPIAAPMQERRAHRDAAVVSLRPAPPRDRIIPATRSGAREECAKTNRARRTIHRRHVFRPTDVSIELRHKLRGISDDSKRFKTIRCSPEIDALRSGLRSSRGVRGRGRCTSSDLTFSSECVRRLKCYGTWTGLKSTSFCVCSGTKSKNKKTRSN